MASLPPGWTADYDGQRWFFTYGPTGQSQFQFPRPGDEFPDFLLCYGAGGPPAAVLFPEVELSPEERLESERQVRRMLKAAGGGGPGGSGSGSGNGGRRGNEVVEDEDEGLLVPRVSPVRVAGGDEGGAVCFGNFAAVKPSGARGLGCRRGDGNRTVGQSGRCDDVGVDMPTTTGVAGFRESTVSVPLVIEGEHAQAASSPHREAGSTAAISIMSEPVMAVAETKAATPPMGHRGGSEHQLAPVAQPSPPGLPMPDGRAMEPAYMPPWARSVGVIPELYSESTALCEEEINPPPVELPGDEGGGNGHAVVPNLPVQTPAELPAYEAAPSVSPGKGNSTARPEPKCLASDYAAVSKAGRGETTGAQMRGHDRAGLPSQAARSSEKSLDKTSPGERLNSAPGQKLPSRDTDQPAEKAREKPRDLTHFPSVLRPGPRRSSGQQRPPPPSMVLASVTNTSHAAARAQLRQQPQGQRHEGQVEACPVPQEQPTRMPAEPLLLPSHPREQPQRTANPTASPEAPQPPGGGARQQDRPPASVNFVIPIRHISRDELHYDVSGDAAAAGAGSPEYQVRASFASAEMSPERSAPVAGGPASGGASSGLAPGRKTESWGWRAGEADTVQLVGGRSAPGMRSEWSWGWAR